MLKQCCTSFLLGSSGLVGGLVRDKGDPCQHPSQPQRSIHPEGRLPAKVVDQQRRDEQRHNVADLAGRVRQPQRAGLCADRHPTTGAQVIACSGVRRMIRGSCRERRRGDKEEVEKMREKNGKKGEFVGAK